MKELEIKNVFLKIPEKTSGLETIRDANPLSAALWPTAAPATRQYDGRKQQHERGDQRMVSGVGDDAESFLGI